MALIKNMFDRMYMYSYVNLYLTVFIVRIHADLYANWLSSKYAVFSLTMHFVYMMIRCNAEIN